MKKHEFLRILMRITPHKSLGLELKDGQMIINGNNNNLVHFRV